MKDNTTACCDRHTSGLETVASVRAALLLLATPVTQSETVGIAALSGRVLAQDVRAPGPLPPRDNSAVDGYALGDAVPDDFRVIARTAAGEAQHDGPLQSGQAVRIFTGAPVPQGATRVVMQEDTHLAGDRLRLEKLPAAGANIRRQAEDVRTGDLLVARGARLDARHIALLAASGVAAVQVVRPLKVALLSSGKELRDPGQETGNAGIHDSNRWMLRAVLQHAGHDVIDLGILPDNSDAITKALVDAAPRADLILSTGGVSVGEEDHIKAALEAAGGAPQGHRMAVKPGKPVVFGRIGRTVVLGLPGNPVAALVSYQLLAGPVLDALGGCPIQAPLSFPAVAGFDWARSPGREEFFSVCVAERPPGGQIVLMRAGASGSARLSPLVCADGLAVVGKDIKRIAKGDALIFYPFNQSLAV